MLKNSSQSRRPVLLFATILGFALLAHLILRTGPQKVLEHAKAVGWGVVLVILLGGVSHLVKTWAWRLTFRSEIRGVSVARTFALRLASEAAGNFGLAGQVLGDSMRVSLLGSAIPVSDTLSSVALDRGLYIVTTAIVSITGMVTALMLVSLSARWRLYALLFLFPLAAFVTLTAISFRKRWPLLSKAATALARLPGLKQWLLRRQSVIESAEQNLLGYYAERPKAFWASLSLNLASHCLAIAEVYLLLHFMGAKITFVGAFVLEALTKMINLVGALNPGNVGTYEGGNMLITRLFQITSASGLTLALCRRARAIFWAAIGALCLVVLSRTTKYHKSEDATPIQPPDPSSSEALASADFSESDSHSGLGVVISLESARHGGAFVPALAQVGQLPVLLRVILSAQALQPSRVIVCLDFSEAEVVKDGLCRTGRLPANVEWCEGISGSEVYCALRELATTTDRIMLLSGPRTYKPALLQSLSDWNGERGAVALETGDERIIALALSRAVALRFVNERKKGMDTVDEVYCWAESKTKVEGTFAPDDCWQDIIAPEDTLQAERKLDSWLVKPTDGNFARANRRISIPISRQLIKIPITPNMVTLFTLGVSIAAGIFFSRGGYWNMLLGAALSVWASILDGCDGEVARLKLQSTPLGCWLETICDYLYYVIIFVGIAWGLTKTSGTNAWLLCGAVLLLGAALSFAVIGFLRQRMAGDSPDKFLAVWQKQADNRRSNPLLYIGRHTEFLARRCFFPYALLVAALLNITKIVFVVTAFGANMIWIIALYSLFTFSRKKVSAPYRPERPTESARSLPVAES